MIYDTNNFESVIVSGGLRELVKDANIIKPGIKTRLKLMKMFMENEEIWHEKRELFG